MYIVQLGDYSKFIFFKFANKRDWSRFTAYLVKLKIKHYAYIDKYVTYNQAIELIKNSEDENIKEAYLKSLQPKLRQLNRWGKKE